MKRSLAALMIVGLISTGAAYAQDAQPQSSTQDQYPQSQTAPNQSTTTSTTTTTSSSGSSSKHEVMKDCIAREQAGNSTMSTSDAKKACHDAIKAQRDNQDNEPRPQQ
jgi:hypothetical protein